MTVNLSLTSACRRVQNAQGLRNAGIFSFRTYV